MTGFITINVMQPSNQFFQPQTPEGPTQSGPIPPAPSMYNQTPLPVPPGQDKKPVGLIIVIIILSVGLVVAIVFGMWAFGSRQDYKNNVDAKVGVAVKTAQKATTEKNTLAFDETLKNPLKEYVGPSSYGSVKVQYPKTWSGYISTGNNSSEPLVALFHPDVVPAASSGNMAKQAIALNVSVLNQSYDSVINSKKGSSADAGVSAVPYALPKMPDQVGLKFSGKLTQDFNGTEVILPLRDKTLVITTQTDQYLNDFNTYILPNITFVP